MSNTTHHYPPRPPDYTSIPSWEYFEWPSTTPPGRELFRFIDWLLQLPEALEERFWAELSAHEEAQKMSYVTSVERIGIKKGIQQGIPQGEARILQRLLQRRFGPLPEWASEKLAHADQASLESWADRVLEAGTLEEVFAEG